MVRAPSARATWSAAEPTPPAAPLNKTVSPSRRRPRRCKTAIAVAVVDAVIGGAALALAVGIASGTSLAMAVLIGAAAAVSAIGAAMRFQHARRKAGTLHPVRFPSDAP